MIKVLVVVQMRIIVHVKLGSGVEVGVVLIVVEEGLVVRKAVAVHVQFDSSGIALWMRMGVVMPVGVVLDVCSSIRFGFGFCRNCSFR